MAASRGSHLTYLLGTLCVLNWVPVQLEAAPATVAFDVAGLVECRDVTTLEFASVHPRDLAELVRFQDLPRGRWGAV